jgi:glycosyltransferase involved in cell wall biosynthesis
MKIAEIVSTFPPYKAGMGNVAFNLSWQLQAQGHQVTVFTPSASKGVALDHLYPFKVSRMRPWLQYGNAGFLPQLLWRLQGFDIVHLHYPFFGGAEMIYMLDKVVDIKLVIHYHMDVYGQGMMEKFFNWHSQQVMPRILDRADKIIVTSYDYAQRSRLRERLRQTPDKFIEVPIGVQADTFKPRRRDKELEQKYDLVNKKVIIFIGALDRAHYFKGITYLIKAFQLISSNDEYRLMIIGKGDLSRSYQSLVSSFGLEKKVIFAGFVPDDLLPLYYNLGDIMVLPSIDGSEAFGTVLLEAMASGLPVIASDLPGVRSVVDKKSNGFLVKPRDISSLAKYLDLLLKNPQMAGQFGQAGRAKVLAKYDWSHIGRSVEKIFEDILS